MLFPSHPDIEAQILDLQAKKKEIAQTQQNDKGVGLLEAGYFDSEFYDEGGADPKSRYDGYMTSIAANDDADEDEDEGLPATQKRSYTAPKAVLKDIVQTEKDDFDPFADRRRPTVAEKEDEYRQKRRRLVISPDRVDPFADGGKTPDVGSRTYTQIMREQMLKGEETELRKRILEKSKEGTLQRNFGNGDGTKAQQQQQLAAAAAGAEPRKRGRWDQTVEDQFVPAKKAAASTTPSWADVEVSRSVSFMMTFLSNSTCLLSLPPPLAENPRQ